MAKWSTPYGFNKRIESFRSLSLRAKMRQLEREAQEFLESQQPKKRYMSYEEFQRRRQVARAD